MISHRPLISIALPAFNSGKTLRASVVSILKQTFVDWELLVMDDGSSDDTVDIAQGFDDPRIKVIADGVHRGLPAQLNRAVVAARGKFLARMDADDIAYPERFQKQVDFLEANPEVDLVAGWITVFRSNGTLLGARRFPTTHEQICARPWFGIPMAHPTWMGRIGWFRANQYREDAVRMEDRELLLRTYAKSRFAVIPEVMLGYREDSLSLKKLLLARKNTCKVAAEHAIKTKQVVKPGLVIAGQIVRGALEAFALPTGLKYAVLRNRAMAPQEHEVREWNNLWATVNASVSMAAQGAECC